MKLVNLKPHNQKTYDNLLRLYEKHKKIAIVQPTGSGKSFIVFKLCQDNPDRKVIIFVPNRYIEKRVSAQASEYGITNLHFMTYQKLIRMNNKEIGRLQADYIVFDEMHRIKATVWEQAAKKVFRFHTDIKYLGMTATPDRMDGRNPLKMFYHELACNMSLGDAVVNGILPTPTYISALYYNLDETKIVYYDILDKNSPEYKEAQKRVSRLVNDVIADYERKDGIPQILKEHIPSENGKYIVFCSNIKRLKIIKPYVIKWFEIAGFKVTAYEIHSENAESDSNFYAFDKDNSDGIRLLFCVDMLSEGVHLDNISGVILLRPTQSKILYFQQIGRAIDANGNDNPLILDFTDNRNTHNAQSLKAEITEAHNRAGNDYNLDNFKVHDYICSNHLKLNKIIDQACRWDSKYREYLYYVQKYGNGNLSAKNHRFNGYYSLAFWCDDQREAYKKGQLSKLKVKLLNDNMFVWDI